MTLLLYKIYIEEYIDRYIDKYRKRVYKWQVISFYVYKVS